MSFRDAKVRARILGVKRCHDIALGGTIAQYMSRFGMSVLDMGTPLLNMHAPCELASKFDCYQTYRAYSAYLRS